MSRALRNALILTIFLSCVFVLINREAYLKQSGSSIVKYVSSISKPTPVLYKYIEVIEGCGPYFVGTCSVARSGPGEEYKVVQNLRIGMVYKVSDTLVTNGVEWYKIHFDEWLRYPERAKGDWYVNATSVNLLEDDGDHGLVEGENISSSTKRIVIDRSEQSLTAYDGDTLYMQTPISSGVDFAPTPEGTFTIYKMTPSRYMQGPIPGASSVYYDLPGVPWNLYFSEKGDVIHGAYWHDKFGTKQSQGCVNVEPREAKKLYLWATVGTTVTVKP